MSDKIRILIADDHTIVRSGLKLLLEDEPDFVVVAEATNGAEAVQICHELHPDVVIMDVGMPVQNGLDAARELKDQLPEIAILALTMHRSEEYFFQMLEAGSSGYVLKGADPAELIQAIRSVARGEVFLYPAMAGRLVKAFLERTKFPSQVEPLLTPREQEIMALLVEGYSSKEIAEKLVISSSTVHSHSSNLMTKLNLSKRHELVRYAREHGLIK